MSFTRTIQGTTSTRAGPVEVTVAVTTKGPDDGAAAVCEEVFDYVARHPRMGTARVSPVVRSEACVGPTAQRIIDSFNEWKQRVRFDTPTAAERDAAYRVWSRQPVHDVDGFYSDDDARAADDDGMPVRGDGE